MTIESTGFQILEAPEQDGRLRLTLLGELDLVSGEVLERRLEELRRERRSVVMDLSRLEFMDSTGLRIMIGSLTSAGANGWGFSIDPNVAPQAERLFKMSSLDQFASMRRRD